MCLPIMLQHIYTPAICTHRVTSPIQLKIVIIIVIIIIIAVASQQFLHVVNLNNNIIDQTISQHSI